MSLELKRSVFGSIWCACGPELYIYAFIGRCTEYLSDSHKSNKDQNKDVKKLKHLQQKYTKTTWLT
jgi:hypothetical protein